MKRVLAVLLTVAVVLLACATAVSAKPAVPPPKDIEKVVFIHYKTPAKPDWAGPKQPKEDEGYKLFRGGVKWADADLPVSYLINKTSVPGNVDPIAAFNEIVAAFEEWDANTGKELYAVAGETTKAGAIKDGDNTIAWVYIDNSNIIAMTTFWYYVNTKELIEFDIEFNSQLAWGIDQDGQGADYVLEGAMDIRNIATHESGHTLVLDDLYQDRYAQMTMYGYSDYGEVKKISLEPGDIDGLHKLYGS